MKISKALKAFVQEQAKDDAYWVERAKLDFAVGLENQRRANKLTYKDVAEKIRSSAAYISKVFRGDSNLTIESMVKLARATGGCLEVRVVSEQSVSNVWATAVSQGKVSLVARKFVFESTDTVTSEAAANDNVIWADQFLWKRAA